VKAQAATYQGRAAVGVTDAAADVDDAGRLAIIPGTPFQDGTIELWDSPSRPSGFSRYEKVPTG
jgi:hypothetical protein